MATLVVGPSCVGKTTFIESSLAQSFIPDSRGLEDAVFGFEFDPEQLAPNALVHYNLLHALAGRTFPASGTLLLDLKKEAVFSNILGSGKITRAVVLVAGRDELIARARSRKVVEGSRPDLGAYPGEHWAALFARVDLNLLYESLFTLLDSQSIPYEVIYSSAELEAGFARSDRLYVHHNLRGNYLLPPSMQAIEKVKNLPGCLYQQVDLPRGQSTSSRGFQHLGGARSSTFQLILNQSIVGDSVLDVGCANGDFLYRAERLGAARLVGIEMSEERHASAVAIGQLLFSRATIHNESFFDFVLNEQFDHVLILNVIHHVKNVDDFLERAAKLTRKRLVIEYPTLSDPVLSKLNGVAFQQDINRFALIGVSGPKADQTYVYTPAALERLLIQNTGAFKRVEHIVSPIGGRMISIFHK